MNATEVISLVAELLSWITLPLGIVLLVFGYIRRTLSPEWTGTPAAVVEVEEESQLVLRWFSPDGSLHESTLDRRLFSDLDPDDEQLTVYFHPERPDHVRLSRPPRNGKHLVQLGWLLTIVGLVSFVLTFLVLLDL